MPLHNQQGGQKTQVKWEDQSIEDISEFVGLMALHHVCPCRINYLLSKECVRCSQQQVSTAIHFPIID